MEAQEVLTRIRAQPQGDRPEEARQGWGAGREADVAVPAQGGSRSLESQLGGTGPAGATRWGCRPELVKAARKRPFRLVGICIFPGMSGLAQRMPADKIAKLWPANIT